MLYTIEFGVDIFNAEEVKNFKSSLSPEEMKQIQNKTLRISSHVPVATQ